MCSEGLGCRFSVSSAQVPLVGFVENVEPFVSPFADVVSFAQLRQASIFVVFATTVVWCSCGLVVVHFLLVIIKAFCKIFRASSFVCNN